MQISELKNISRELYEQAVHNTIMYQERGGSRISVVLEIDKMYLSSAFDWHSSIEPRALSGNDKYEFWSFVNKGYYDKAIAMLPVKSSYTIKEYRDTHSYIGYYLRVKTTNTNGIPVTVGGFLKIHERYVTVIGDYNNYRYSLSKFSSNDFELLSPMEYENFHHDYIRKDPELCVDPDLHINTTTMWPTTSYLDMDVLLGYNTNAITVTNSNDFKVNKINIPNQPKNKKKTILDI
jgi:hypothetical protein